MLPVQSLDNERYSDIAQDAKERIPKLYPQWTDFNYHDPGITFIELFAWLKEMQQYHIDQIGQRNRLKFLKILNTTQRPKQPARANVRIHSAVADTVLYQGTQLLAGDILFETMRPEPVAAAQMLGFYTVSGGQRVDYSAQPASSAGKLRCPFFGYEPAPGDRFYIGVDAAPRRDLPYSLYFNIHEDYPVMRNPIRSDFDFVPLARLRWEYHGADGWRELRLLRDETRQFLRDGKVVFQLDGEMAKMPGQDGYWLRVELLENNYDVPPAFNDIALNAIEVEQRETLSVYEDFAPWEDQEKQYFPFHHGLVRRGKVEAYGRRDGEWFPLDPPRRVETTPDETRFEVHLPPQYRGGDRQVRLTCYADTFMADRIVGEGDGFPGQEFHLYETRYLQTGFALLVADGPHGGFTEWSQTIDFDASTPFDRHYVFDEEAGTIAFGDCEHGMAPRGEIRIIACARSLGRDGNVKSGKIDRFVRPDVEMCVFNPDNAYGGENRETISDSFMRVRTELRRVERAITYEDYEHLVMETPGLMIRNCRAIPVSSSPRPDGSLDESCVSIVVQPYAGDEVRKLNPAYIENIYGYLQDRRLVGARVSVLSPEYIGIQVYAEIGVKPYYPDARERIRKAVEVFFGDSAWEFGRPVLYSNLYGIIDTLDCVSDIQSLSIDAQGKGITRSVNGDVLLPQNGMAYLKAAEFMTTSME